MKIHIINKLYFIFLFLIIFIANDTNKKDLSKQCDTNDIYNFINIHKYKSTHCFNNGPINNFINTYDKNNVYCIKCLKKKNKKNSNCKKCNITLILNDLKIFSPHETLDEIIKNNKSISRYGDGEFSLIFGKSIGYQRSNKNLARKLYKVLKSEEEGLLIGIPNTLNPKFLNNLIAFAKNYWKKWIVKNKFKILLLNKNKIYYSSFISRFYIDYKDKSGIKEYIKKLKKIWEQKDVLIIEGDKSRLGVGNDLFDNMKSIQRIICPSINAFRIYNKILDTALKVEKNKLILIALGPTASILAYDLYMAGYQAIDIGHVDIEYEWYLRNTSRKIKIEGKFVNEVKNGKRIINEVKDKKYYTQIIAKILN